MCINCCEKQSQRVQHLQMGSESPLLSSIEYRESSSRKCCYFEITLQSKKNLILFTAIQTPLITIIGAATSYIILKTSNDTLSETDKAGLIVIIWLLLIIECVFCINKSI